MPPLTVTSSKRRAPSGDPHDFVACASFWWRNPAAPDGLPWIYRDGRVSPDLTEYPDPENFARVAEAALALATEYVISGDERYAARTAKLVQVWLLDSSTSMNPNLNYAAIVPGRPDSPDGVLYARSLIPILDAVGLIGDSPAWRDGDQLRLRTWLRLFRKWLQTSPEGRAAAQRRDSLGAWRDATEIAISRALGEDVRAEIMRLGKQRIEAQIAPDGSQPEALKRTLSLDYSVSDLLALAALADVGRNSGVDLWIYSAPDGRSIRKALDFLIPYVAMGKRWPYKQIAPMDLSRLYALLVTARAGLQDPKYGVLALRFVRSGPDPLALILHPGL